MINGLSERYLEVGPRRGILCSRACKPWSQRDGGSIDGIGRGSFEMTAPLVEGHLEVGQG